MTVLLILFTIFLIGVLIFQISKANEYIATLRGEDKTHLESDSMNGKIWLVFGILFLVGVIWSTFHFMGRFLPESASEHGRWIDSMFNTTLFFTGIIFILTHIALFYFAWRYRQRKGKVAYYYPENNRLEMLWTIIPAVVLTALVVVGLYNWFRIMGPAPANAKVVEITGKQFNWLFRYPGNDGKLGKREFHLIDDVNSVGIDFSDKNALDDVMPNELHFEVNQPYLLKIHARDVIHSVGLNHFRIKMDAMPGIPTHFWFTPTITTDEMRIKTNNPNFNYEMNCDMICGKGHAAMKAMVYVDTHEQYQAWLAKQPSFYETSIKGTDEEKKFVKPSVAGVAGSSVHSSL